MNKIPRNFMNCREVKSGIYECNPSDQTSQINNSVWTILKNDFSKITDEELKELIYVKTIKEGRYLYETKNNKRLIAIQKTTDFILDETKDDILLYRNPSFIFSDISPRDKLVTPKNPISQNRYDSPQPDDRKVPHAYRDELPLREKLNDILTLLGGNRIESPLRPRKLNLFKSKKKSLKKNKKSLKKSKTSINCKKTPYAWKPSFIKKSPFRILKRAKEAESKYKAGQSIGFTAISSLKSLGRIPRSDGCYVLGTKYSELKRQ